MKGSSPGLRASRSGKISLPGTWAILLLALGVAIAGFTWGIHWRNVAKMTADSAGTPDPWVEEQIELLRRQNDRLVEEVWRLQAFGGESGERWSRPLDLEKAVTNITGSPFSADPVYRLAHPAEIDDIRLRELDAWLDERAFEATGLLFGLAGIGDTSLDFQQMWLRLSHADPPIAYDSASNTILVAPTVDPAQPANLRAAAAALALAWLDNQHGIARIPTPKIGDLNAGLARHAFIHGFASFIADRVEQASIEEGGESMPGFLASTNDDAHTILAPDFLRDLHTFSGLEGAAWWAEIWESEGSEAITEFWNNKTWPESTQSFLGVEHPRSTTRPSPPPAPANSFLSWSGNPGPFFFLLFAKELETNEDLSNLAEIWLGDSLTIAAVDTGDLVALWHVQWTSDNAASLGTALFQSLAQFMPDPEEGLRRTRLLHRHSENATLWILASSPEAAASLEEKARHAGGWE